MDFRGEARRATEADIARIAAKLGVPYYRLRGVIEVEAAGKPFDAEGRPTMLFEPHKFYERMDPSKRAAAVKAGVAQKARPKSYPKESYTRIATAMEFDEDAALESASWGSGQIMGFNHHSAGFDSAREMVEAFMESEANQLAGMAEFIENKPSLLRALKSVNAEAFAEGYNGSGYAKMGYHHKITNAWAKWKRKPTPEFERDEPEEEEVEEVDDEPTQLDTLTIRAAQERLRTLRYVMVGDPDGKLGSRTTAAISAFQKANALPVTGKLDEVTRERLGSEDAMAMPISEERRKADGKEVAEKVPETKAVQDSGFATRLQMIGASIMGFIYMVKDWLAELGIPLRKVRDAISDIPTEVIVLVAVAFAVLVWWLSRRAEQKTLDLYRSGKLT